MSKTYVDENSLPADWNENNGASVSYIKNRTHYIQQENESETPLTINAISESFDEIHGNIHIAFPSVNPSEM